MAKLTEEYSPKFCIFIVLVPCVHTQHAARTQCVYLSKCKQNPYYKGSGQCLIGHTAGDYPLPSLWICITQKGDTEKFQHRISNKVARDSFQQPSAEVENISNNSDSIFTRMFAIFVLLIAFVWANAPDFYFLFFMDFVFWVNKMENDQRTNECNTLVYRQRSTVHYKSKNRVCWCALSMMLVSCHSGDCENRETKANNIETLL